MDFFRGLLAPLRGAAFVARHRLWRYLAAPVLVTLALAAGAAWAALDLARGRVGATALADWRILGGLGLGVLALLVGVIAFVLLQPLVSAPFLDALCGRVEAIAAGAAAPAPGLVRELWLAVAHGALKLGLYALALGVAALLGVVSGVGGLLGGALWGLSLAFDGFDYPLARRSAGFRAKLAFLARHPGLTAGFALGASALVLFPLTAPLAPAFAAAGATLAFLETTPR